MTRIHQSADDQRQIHFVMMPDNTTRAGRPCRVHIDAGGLTELPREDSYGSAAVSVDGGCLHSLMGTTIDASFEGGGHAGCRGGGRV